jgi:hypothetical protein
MRPCLFPRNRTCIHEQTIPSQRSFLQPTQCSSGPGSDDLYKNLRRSHQKCSSGINGLEEYNSLRLRALANIAFSTVKLVAAQALKGSIVTLPIAIALECGAVYEIAGELYYAYEPIPKLEKHAF